METGPRLVLDDCRVVLEKLKTECEKQQYRILWVAALTLCRAVGHVIKSETKISPGIRQVVQKKFNKWTNGNDVDDLIFREFIKKERDIMIKEYTQRYDDSCLDLYSCKDVYAVIDIYNCTISTGHYKGKSAYEVLHEAATWWEKQLVDIEKCIT